MRGKKQADMRISVILRFIWWRTAEAAKNDSGGGILIAGEPGQTVLSAMTKLFISSLTRTAGPAVWYTDYTHIFAVFLWMNSRQNLLLFFNRYLQITLILQRPHIPDLSRINIIDIILRKGNWLKVRFTAAASPDGLILQGISNSWNTFCPSFFAALITH